MYVRNTKKFVLENFLSDLDNCLLKFESYFNGFTVDKRPNANVLCDEFIDIFNRTLHKHAPLRKLTKRERKLKEKPWITKCILTSIKNKNKLYKDSLKIKTDESIRIYKKYKNELTHIKELSKKQYYREQTNIAQQSSELIWKTINDIVQYKKVKKAQINEIISND